MGSDTNAAIERVSLRYAPLVSSNFQIVTCDGTTQNIAASLGAADTNVHTIYLEIDSATPRILYSFDGGTVTVVTANIPAMATPLALYCRLRNYNAAENKFFDFWWLEGAND